MHSGDSREIPDSGDSFLLGSNRPLAHLFLRPDADLFQFGVGERMYHFACHGSSLSVITMRPICGASSGFKPSSYSVPS
jgi:hypothetical protein